MGKRLIIGLGNPGVEYEGTRHNVGFAVVDALAEAKGVQLTHDRDAVVGWGRHRGLDLGLVKPLTYVNRSGEAAKRLLRAHALDPEALLVVVDDLDLPVGAVRLKPGGGSAGHNGMNDLIRRLGTDQFPRLRLGIGHDFPRGAMVDYVLSPFTPDERPFVREAIEHACAAALAWAIDGAEAAMNRYN